MPQRPDQHSLLNRLLGGLGQRSGDRPRRSNRNGTGRWPSERRWAPIPGAGRRGRGVLACWGQRASTLGSALVQALLVGLIALIGALLLASRLFSSRFNSFSRSDTLAAREAAEYGLNELQAQLNSDLYGYLWVTKRNNWSTVSRSALTSCQVSVLDPSGNEVTNLPTLPAGVTIPKTIRTDSDATITYQLTSFDPPSLPDNATDTQNQAEFCGNNNSTSAANFGNLNGGSALVTVTGTVTRGNTQTQFKLSRRPHVLSPARQLAFSFIILGDAYNDTINNETFGASADIAKLNYFDGNICYGKITDTTCFTTPPPPKTTIGCYDLGSCLINNIDIVDTKLRSKYCADVKAKKKQKKGFTCNSFQQIGPLPPIPTPLSTGFLNDTGDTFTLADFDGTDNKGKGSKAVELECKLKDSKCKSNLNGDFDTLFPYKGKNIPSKLDGLANSDLVDGCYFNNVNSTPNTAYNSSKTTAISCLFSKLKIKDEDKKTPT